LTGLGAGTRVTGVTSDGSVICGTAGGNRAFIWSQSAGLKLLPLPSGATSAQGVGVGLYNGTVVVAVNTDAASYKAKRWEGTTAGAGTLSICKLNGTLEWIARGLGTNGTSDFWISALHNGGDGGGRKRRGTRGRPTRPSRTLSRTWATTTATFHAVATTATAAASTLPRNRARRRRSQPDESTRRIAMAPLNS